MSRNELIISSVLIVAGLSVGILANNMWCFGIWAVNGGILIARVLMKGIK